MVHPVFQTLAAGTAGEPSDDQVLLIMLAVFGGIFLVAMGIQAGVCWLVAGFLKAIPEQHRRQTPGMVWLLMIPLFSCVWVFFVYPKIAESYKSHFDSVGRTDVGDCGKNLAIAYCIVLCCSLVAGALAVPAAFVIWIILLVKFSSLKGQVGNGGTGGFPVGQVLSSEGGQVQGPWS